MKPNEINGISPKEPQKYYMNDLGIKENSHEASIFNRIDESDGKKDGYLTIEQFSKYNQAIQLENNEINLQMPEQKADSIIEATKNKLRINKNELTIKKFGTLYSDYPVEYDGNYVTIKKLNIENYKVETSEDFRKLCIKIQEQEFYYKMLEEAQDNII